MINYVATHLIYARKETEQEFMKIYEHILA